MTMAGRSYIVPSGRMATHTCKTNHNRGIGRGYTHPQMCLVAENYMTEIADLLGMPQDKVQYSIDIYELFKPTSQDGQVFTSYYFPTELLTSSYQSPLN